MKNKKITYFLIFLALLIVAVIALNYINSKPKNAKENPYEYNIDEFKKVDPELIHYKETRQIKVSLDEHAGITTFNGNIFLASNRKLTVITPEGKKISEFEIQPDARAIAANENKIVVAYKDSVIRYDHEGTIGMKSSFNPDSTVLTSVALWGHKIVIADAGKRKIICINDSSCTSLYSTEIEGISGAKNLQGFIIPSPYFEVTINAENELWCTNPGMHAIQQYNENGDLLAAWDKASLDIDGFTGCCNPAQLTTLPDGRFVTSEKGLPRIKIYKKDGTLESVVAAPSKFEGNQHAAEVAVIGETIIALDFDREMIRIFEKK